MVPQFPMPEKSSGRLHNKQNYVPLLKTVWSTCSHCTPVDSATFELIILCTQHGSMHSSRVNSFSHLLNSAWGPQRLGAPAWQEHVEMPAEAYHSHV